MTIKEQVRELGYQLKNRLDPELVDDALGYIDHSELVLAFETLCDHIADYDVVLSSAEYQRILQIVALLKLELTNRYQYIDPAR